MGIYGREHFKNANEAAMYYISIMNNLTNELSEAVQIQDSQRIISIGNVFLDVSEMLRRCQEEQINFQQSKVKEIMRPHVS